MDVTFLPDNPSLLTRIQRDYSDIHFSKAELFKWSPSEKTVYFCISDFSNEEEISQFFHELAHAVLSHQEYRYDIELLQIETAAWYKGIELAENYDIKLNVAYAEECIDTYRQWLHSRSTCPDCHQNGVQKSKNTYQCINCRCSWRVNGAKLCSLKRYKLAN